MNLEQFCTLLHAAGALVPYTQFNPRRAPAQFYGRTLRELQSAAVAA